MRVGEGGERGKSASDHRLEETFITISSRNYVSPL